MPRPPRRPRSKLLGARSQPADQAQRPAWRQRSVAALMRDDGAVPAAEGDAHPGVPSRRSARPARRRQAPDYEFSGMSDSSQTSAFSDGGAAAAVRAFADIGGASSNRRPSFEAAAGAAVGPVPAAKQQQQQQQQPVVQPPQVARNSGRGSRRAGGGGEHPPQQKLTSAYVGVCWSCRSNKWRAQLNIRGKVWPS
jgi:hypothetical protein